VARRRAGYERPEGSRYVANVEVDQAVLDVEGLVDARNLQAGARALEFVVHRLEGLVGFAGGNGRLQDCWRRCRRSASRGGLGRNGGQREQQNRGEILSLLSQGC